MYFSTALELKKNRITLVWEYSNYIIGKKSLNSVAFNLNKGVIRDNFEQTINCIGLNVEHSMTSYCILQANFYFIHWITTKEIELSQVDENSILFRFVTAKNKVQCQVLTST